MRSSRLSRTVRGSMAAGIATFVALLSHVSAGGSVPGFGGVAVPLILSIVVSVLVTGRRLSLPRLIAAVGASQVLFHTLFVLGSGGVVSATGHAGHAGHAAGGVVLQTVQLPPVVSALPAVQMWLSHALAAALTVLALHRGERALRRLVDGARLVAVQLVRSLDVFVAVPFRSLPALAAASVPRPLVERVTVAAISYRGPPSARRAVQPAGN